MRAQITVLFLLSALFAFSQNKEREQQVMYKSAFDEITGMIKCDKPYIFKRAVYLSENAYYKGEWVNLEATSGSFSRSSFIMESFEITTEQI